MTAPRPGSADQAPSRTEPSPVNLPNALTLLRVVLVPVFVWLLLRDGGHDGDRESMTDLQRADRWWATGVFLLATVTDWLDGFLARRQGIVTAFGKLMDPIADKALMGSALICLSLLGELPWWVTVVILVRELGITLMRLVVIRRGVIAASRGGKIKTVLQAVGLTMMLMPTGGVLAEIGLWVMYLAAVVTVVTGLDYVRQVVAPGRR